MLSTSLLRNCNVGSTHIAVSVPVHADWGSYIDVVGFCFLDLATEYKPPPDLDAFLKEGPPPVFVGFGSLVSSITSKAAPDPLSLMRFSSLVPKTGQCARSQALSPPAESSGDTIVVRTLYVEVCTKSGLSGFCKADHEA